MVTDDDDDRSERDRHIAEHYPRLWRHLLAGRRAERRRREEEEKRQRAAHRRNAR
jgi:hypothetical protein